jgi:ADP-heptose:LPS heptosyltransferase
MPYTYSNKKKIFSNLLEFLLFVVFCFVNIFLRSKKNKVCSVLLVEPFQMGDILSLTPMITPIKKKYPDAKIYVLTKISSGLVLKYDSRIEEVFFCEFPWSDYGKKKSKVFKLLGMIKNVWQLSRPGFDIGIDTRGDVRSQMLLMLAGCKQRVGYTNYLNSNINLSGFLLTDKKTKSKYKHRYLWNLELLECLDIKENEVFPVEFPSYKPNKLDVNIKPVFDNYSLVHIGGGWEYKRWDESKWIELIKRLVIEKKQSVYVVSGKGESDILDRIKLHFTKDDPIIFCVTSMEELVVFTQKCNVFYGLDSGPMNLAVCLDKPVVGIFGPGDSEMWKPINTASKYIHKNKEFPCSPCLQIVCVHPNRSCMKVIQVDEVMSL